MKLLRECLIILVIYFIGEFISSTFNLSIPGNIIGMILLLVLLMTNVVKVEQIETVSNFLLDHLAFFFLPAGVGLITAISILKADGIQLVVIAIVSTLVVMSVTVIAVEGFIKKAEKNKNKNISKDKVKVNNK